MNPLEARFARIQLQLDAVLPSLPALAGAIIVQHSDEAFRNQGWTDNALEEWTKRKSDDAKSQGRAILVKTGHLRGSIHVIRTTANSVVVGTYVPYAKVHNEGLDATVSVGAFSRNQYGNMKLQSIKTRRIRSVKGIIATQEIRSHTRHSRITKRQFLGNSHQQTEKIRELFREKIRAAFK